MTPDLAGALDRPDMPAPPPAPRAGRGRTTGRERFVGDIPAEDYAALTAWARDSNTSRIALIVAMIRLVPCDPEVRLAVEEEAIEYHRQSRAR